MSFKLLHESLNYIAYCKANNSNGVCFGQSWLWLSDIISGVSSSLAPPDFRIGATIHKEYREAFASAGGNEAYLRGKVSALKLRFPEKALQMQIADDYASSVKLVNAFPSYMGCNSAILMSWGLNEKKSTLNKVLCRYDEGHAMALLKLKNNGKIYLFDPNKGVFEWARSSGVELKTDIKLFMLESPRFAMASMTDSMMLSTQSDIPLNFEHVIV